MTQMIHENESRALTLKMVHMLSTNPSFQAQLKANPSAALDAAGFTAQLQALKAAPTSDGGAQKCKRWSLCEDTCYVTCLRTTSI
jgi:hypothetical protein